MRHEGRLAAGAILAAAALFGAGLPAEAGTLDDVKARGTVLCGVSTGLAGFSEVDNDGNWSGIDVDLCHGVAAAVFGDAKKVRFVPTTNKERFTALQSGEIDLLARNTTWTFVRDVNLGFEFVGVNYYDGQGFLVPSSLAVSSALELDGAKICIKTGTTTELNLADYFRTNGISYESVVVTDDAEIRRNYVAGACDAYTTDRSALAAMRSTLPDPSGHIILPEVISKEPLGPVVRHGDSQWGDVVRWTLNAMIVAEELGVTSANADDLMGSTENPEIKRLLGSEGDLGAMLGLTPTFAKDVIKAVGNYSESFERHVGKDTPIGLDRGLNALWTDGGILYAPPFR